MSVGRQLKESYLDSVDLDDVSLVRDLRNLISNIESSSLADIDKFAHLNFVILQEYDNALRAAKLNESALLTKDIIRRGVPVPAYSDPSNVPPADEKCAAAVNDFIQHIQNKLAVASELETFLYYDIRYRKALREAIPQLVSLTHNLREQRDKQVDRQALVSVLIDIQNQLGRINCAYRLQNDAYNNLPEQRQQRQAAAEAVARLQMEAAVQSRRPVEHRPTSSQWNWKKILGWGLVGAGIAVASAFTFGVAGVVAGGSAIGGGFIFAGIGAVGMNVLRGIGNLATAAWKKCFRVKRLTIDVNAEALSDDDLASEAASPGGALSPSAVPSSPDSPDVPYRLRKQLSASPSLQTSDDLPFLSPTTFLSPSPGQSPLIEHSLHRPVNTTRRHSIDSNRSQNDASNNLRPRRNSF